MAAAASPCYVAPSAPLVFSDVTFFTSANYVLDYVTTCISRTFSTMSFKLALSSWHQIIVIAPDHLDLPPHLIQHNHVINTVIIFCLSTSSTLANAGYIGTLCPRCFVHYNHHGDLLCWSLRHWWALSLVSLILATPYVPLSLTSSRVWQTNDMFMCMVAWLHPWHRPSLTRITFWCVVVFIYSAFSYVWHHPHGTQWRI